MFHIIELGLLTEPVTIFLIIMSYDRFSMIKLWQALACKLKGEGCKGLIAVDRWGMVVLGRRLSETVFIQLEYCINF